MEQVPVPFANSQKQLEESIEADALLGWIYVLGCSSVRLECETELHPNQIHNKLYMDTYQITYHDDCVIIWNSYKIRELSKMRQVLKYIKETHPGILNNRSEFSMLNEWRSHNLLYDLKILRNRTKDVNINYKLPLWAEIGYTILSPFYFNFR